MLYPTSPATVLTALFACGLLLAFHLLSRRRPARSPWPVAAIASAGDHLPAAFLLAIVGAIAFYGYDGFLYAIGIVAGALIARLTIFRSPSNAHPLPATSAAIVSLLFLIPQLVALFALLKTILPLAPPWGLFVLLLLTLPFAVRKPSTTMTRCIRTALILLCSIAITCLILYRGLSAKPDSQFPRRLSSAEFNVQLAPTDILLRNTGEWAKTHYVRIRHGDGSLSVWTFTGIERLQLSWPAATFTECQMITRNPAGKTLINGRATDDPPANHLQPVGTIRRLSANAPGPLTPTAFLATLQQSDIDLPTSNIITDDAGTHTIYSAKVTSGEDVLAPGNDPSLFPNLRSKSAGDRLNFISFMLALLCGAAVVPHFASEKSPSPQRRSITLAMAIVALVYLLSLFLGLGAMTSGRLDPSNLNSTLPLFFTSLGPVGFAVFSAIFFVAILGGISDLLWCAAQNLAPSPATPAAERTATLPPKRLAAFLLILSIALAFASQHIPLPVLIAWAFNIAASTLFPAFAIPLFWKRATRQAIRASTIVGLLSSSIWILLSRDAFQFLYGYRAADAALHSPLSFAQPALVALPLSFITLVVVSLLTPRERISP